MRNGHIQSAKTELERLQKQGNTAANRRAAEQRADHGNKSHDTPLLGKEKGDTVLPMPPHRKVKGIVRAVPFPAYSIQWGNFAAKSALKYPPPR